MLLFVTLFVMGATGDIAMVFLPRTETFDQVRPKFEKDLTVVWSRWDVHNATNSSVYLFDAPFTISTRLWIRRAAQKYGTLLQVHKIVAALERPVAIPVFKDPRAFLLDLQMYPRI